MLIAPTGHDVLHCPQSKQLLSTSTALLSIISILSRIHTLLHNPQPMHFSSSILKCLIQITYLNLTFIIINLNILSYLNINDLLSLFYLDNLYSDNYHNITF